MIKSWITFLTASDRRFLVFLLLFQFALYFSIWFLEFSFGFRVKESVGIMFYGNDAHSYLDTIENLIDCGVYGFDCSGPTAFRMPGMLVFYGPLYLLFGKFWGLQLFVLLNFAVFAFGSYCLYRLIKSRYGAQWGVLTVILLSLYLRLLTFGYVGMVELLASGLMMILIYLLAVNDKIKTAHLLWSSAIVAELILLKPVLIVMTPVLAAYVFFRSRRSSYTTAFKHAALLASIPVCVMLTWNVRNYITFKQTTLLTTTLNMQGGDHAFRTWCRVTGQEYQAFNGEDARAWFVLPSNSKYTDQFASSNPFPAYVFTSYYNLDSLKSLRSDWHRAQLEPDTILAAKLDKNVETRFLTYTSSFQEENTFHFIVTARLIHLKNMLFIRDSFAPFAGAEWYWSIMKAYYFLSYYAIIALFFLFVFSVLLRRVKLDSTLALAFAVCIVYILAHITLGRIENRYLMPIMPLFVFLGIMSVKSGYEWLRSVIFDKGVLSQDR